VSALKNSLQKSLPWIIAWACLDLAVQESVGRALSRVQSHASEMLPWLAGLAALQMIAEMLLSALWMIGVVRNFQVGPPPLAPLKALNQLLIESTRALAAVLYRVPLLLFPALVEFVRLAYVSYTVIFDPEYWHGRVDAIARSRDLTKGQFWVLGVALSFTGPGWTFIKWILFGDDMNLFENPVMTLTAEGLGIVVNLLVSFWIYNLYQKALRRNAPSEGIYATGI
jgi:hypothetical protein